MKPKPEDSKEMVGGCCVCSDENGWAENPLVYCDGQGCSVAVHQACYGIVTVPTGSWFCRKCESQERAARVHCELCPSKDGALKRTDSGGWAHVVCALYIPEVRFGNVTTMEPIMLQLVPPERFNKSCCICEEKGKESRASVGACMQCNKAGCKQTFHVTCAQAMGLLCEEAGNYLDNVKYCGYCQHHFSRLLPSFQRKGSQVKTIPPYRPIMLDTGSSDDEKVRESKDCKLKKRVPKPLSLTSKILIGRDNKPVMSESINNLEISCPEISDFSNNICDIGNTVCTSSSSVKLEVKSVISESIHSNDIVPISTACTTAENKVSSTPCHTSNTVTVNAVQVPILNNTTTTVFSTPVSLPITTLASIPSSSGTISGCITSPQVLLTSCAFSAANISSVKSSKTLDTGANLSVLSEGKSNELTVVSQPTLSSVIADDKDKQRKLRVNGPRTPSGNSNFGDTESVVSNEEIALGELNICEEKNLSAKETEKDVPLEISKANPPEKVETSATNMQFPETSKRTRVNMSERGRRAKRGGLGKRGRTAAAAREDRSRDSGASSPDSFTSETPAPKRGRKKFNSKESLSSALINGVGPNTLLLGNQINPTSSVAQKMTDTLQAEMEAHSIYSKDEDRLSNHLVGPPFPLGKKENTSQLPTAGMCQLPPFPQSLEQLLERQWEQGSQFLMEQAQHFDIASLLSCLYQLRQENMRLEETVNSLIARRDHLLAVNARLSIPLSSPQPTTNSGPASVTLAAAVTGNSTNHPTPGSGPQGNYSSHVVVSSVPPTSTKSLPQGRHPSGGSHSSNISSGGVSSHRGASPHDRKPIPLENGLPEPEYRYRSPSSEQHRQQSPMLPPGPQGPSPTSVRHSPAAGYHTSASPHGGISSLSPGITHAATVVGHPPSIVARSAPEHRGSELVRIHSGPSHSVGYYQMVSPPVPHHSPLSMSSSVPHTQVMRREIETSRVGPLSNEKR